jgi:cysteine synthase A
MSWVSLDSRYRDVLLGAALGVSLVFTSASLAAYVHSTRQHRQREEAGPEFSARPIELRSDEVVDGVAGLIGKCDDTMV